MSATIEQLRAELMKWCGYCPGDRNTPAVVKLTWSDRESRACAGCIGEAVVSVALDHSYDRRGITPYCTRTWQNPILELPPPPEDVVERVGRACVAARAYLDEVAPMWRDHTVHDFPDDRRDELLRRCQEASR